MQLFNYTNELLFLIFKRETEGFNSKKWIIIHRTVFYNLLNIDKQKKIRKILKSTINFYPYIFIRRIGEYKFSITFFILVTQLISDNEIHIAISLNKSPFIPILRTIVSFILSYNRTFNNVRKNFN
jgi:hypothetical protein